MTAATLTLTEFLLARIGEDEASARVLVDNPGDWWPRDAQSKVASAAMAFDDGPGDPARVLAECEAKRRIVAEHDVDPCVGTFGPEGSPCPTMRILAAIHADHPDYRSEWTP